MTVEQILQQRHAVRDNEPPDTDDAIDDLGGFGLLRGIRDRALTVELRKKDDTVLAIPYALIEQFLYSPTEGITLRAAGREIRVRGRYLNEPSMKPLSLFTALTRQRVLWIVEKSRCGASGDNATVVDSIAW